MTEEYKATTGLKYPLAISDLADKDLLLLHVISGSRAYGLDTPSSDTDYKGVFVLPKKAFYAMNYTGQINNATNDEMYYELGKFMDLLNRNNPNIMELIAAPEDTVLHKDPLFKLLKPELFISKLCKETFANYAMSQVKKARNLNKKVFNPVERERRSVLDFCYVQQGQSAVPLTDYLSSQQIDQHACGLSSIPHMPGVYGLYHDPSAKYKGIAVNASANDISLSSIEKDAEPVALMTFNKEAYSTYCKHYTEYWNWVKNRNEVRYQNTMQHGKNYDAKNMLHLFRLLAMAEEIGKEAKLRIRRPDRDFLLAIKRGEYQYEDLLNIAREKLAGLDDIYERSDLQEKPDLAVTTDIHYEIRQRFYDRSE